MEKQEEETRKIKTMAGKMKGGVGGGGMCEENENKNKTVIRKWGEKNGEEKEKASAFLADAQCSCYPSHVPLSSVLVVVCLCL